MITKIFNSDIDRLISHINEYLLPKFKLVVDDLSEKYINVEKNITKSTKCVSLYKIGDNVPYDVWYYNEINLELLHKWCYTNSFKDRDRDVDKFLAYEYKEICQKIKLSLDNYKN